MIFLVSIINVSCFLVSRPIEYVQRFATKEAADAADNEDEDGEDEEMSDIGSISDDEEAAGHMDI